MPGPRRPWIPRRPRIPRPVSVGPGIPGAHTGGAARCMSTSPRSVGTPGTLQMAAHSDTRGARRNGFRRPGEPRRPRPGPGRAAATAEATPRSPSRGVAGNRSAGHGRASPSGCGRSQRGWLTTGPATASTSTRATTPPTPPTQSGPHLRRWRQINRCAAGRARNWPDRRSVLRAEHRPPPGPFRIRQRGLEPPWRAPTAPDPHPRSPHPCRRLPTLVTRLRPHRLAGPGRIASHGLSRSPRRP